MAIAYHVDAPRARDRLDVFQTEVRDVLVRIQGVIQQRLPFKRPDDRAKPSASW
jgi:hypothetical protein